MSHTQTSRDGRWAIHHNSDWSGDVRIVDTETGESLEVPATAILSAVAYGYVLPQRMSHLEETGWRELLAEKDTVDAGDNHGN